MALKFFLNAVPLAASLDEYNAGVRLPGSDPARFQALLQRLARTAIIADEGGMEGICWSEQHCNVEGVPEPTTNPILFGAFIGARTKRLKVGQLGVTLTANHPVRVAEDLAILDHMVDGRLFCGFTRGNSPRWVNMFGQYYGLAATESDKSAADELNLRAVKEAWTIIKKAWTQETFSHDGEFWKIPAPNTHWGYPGTRDHGAGMRDDGVLEEIGIVPRPLQQPFPRVFSPLAFRMTTAKFWASEGGTAVCFTTKNDFLEMASRVLAEELAQAGFSGRAPLAPGAFLLLGKDEEDVAKLRYSYDQLMSRFFTVPPFNIPPGRMFIGTPDDISREIEELLGVFEFEDIFFWHNIGFISDAVELSAVELLVNKVLPRFAD